MNIFSARKLSRYLLLSRTGCFNDPCILTRKALSTAAAATAAATATASPSPSLVGSSIRLPPGPSLHHFILQAGLAVPSSDQTSLDLDAMQVPYLSGTLDKSVQQGRIYIESYGCQMNVNDLEIVLAILKKAGYTDVVEKADNADVILINTCAIRDNAENKIWHRLNYFKHIKLKRYKNGETAPKVAVLGCMAERLKEKLVDANKMVDVVCGPDAYRDLPRLLASVDQGYTAVNTILSLEETYADVTPIRISKSSISAFVSIMRGCNNMCSFCIVPFTRGRERSRPVASIVDEVKQLRDQGLKEVWLLGQNVNSYNDVLRTPVGDSEADDGGRTRPWSLSSGFSSICKNKKDGLRFSDLLDRLSSLFPDIRFRFTSPHPKDFPDELLFLMQERPNVCKSIHLPAQSGSTKILERMRRGYTREAYLSLVERIRSIVPDCSLSSDFIAGFCGETEEDHADTLSLIEAVGYDMAYMFAYSLREKTHAHRNYEDDVPELVKQRRLSEMISTFRHTTVPRYESQLGTTQLVLITGPNKRNSSEWIGLSDKGHRVVFPNQLLPIACSSGAYDGNDNSHDKQCDTQLVSDLSEPSMMLDSSNNIGRGPPKFRWPCPGDYVEVRITETSAASLRGYPVNCTDLISFLSQHSPSMA